MRVPEEDYTILEDFVQESLAGVKRATPFVKALVEQPDREDILPKVTEHCFHLFHSIKGTGGFLQLDQLVRPAEAMEYLLDRIRSGVQSFTPMLVSLLAESCQFMEKGLPLLLINKSDERLATSAQALTAAIFQAMKVGEEDSWVDGSAALEPHGMHDTFLLETENLLTTAEQEFVLWDFIAMDHQRMEDLCRLLHRLKQNFALFELKDLERLCLALESALTRYLQGEFFQTEYPERVFLRSIDAVRSALTSITRLGDVAVTGLDHHLAALQGLMRQPIGTLLIEAGLVNPQVIEDALEVQKSCRDTTPRRLGEVLVDMGEVTPDQIQHILQAQHSNRARAAQAETILSSVCQPQGQPSPASAVYNEISIDGRKIARIVELVNQLAVLYQPEGAAAGIFSELKMLAKSCNQEALAAFSSRLKRLVHDLAVQYNKRVYFVIEGIDTLLDQRDIFLLADPLLYLLRNGVEHGLETVEERMLAGKRKSGKLTLTALQHGAEIWVSIEDDGQGFDMKKIANLAVAQNLVDREGVANLTPRELAQLFFRSQTSIDNDSQGAPGQNAGLTLVRDRIQQLQGRVEMLTRPDKGTRITLKVPQQH
ncbi:MAG: Hpt domain-containing protein [Desulfobulbaceae bacterium]|nr:Hpt domain-containing protein [Desulfobulbaceae bacterium]